MWRERMHDMNIKDLELKFRVAMTGISSDSKAEQDKPSRTRKARRPKRRNATSTPTTTKPTATSRMTTSPVTRTRAKVQGEPVPTPTSAKAGIPISKNSVHQTTTTTRSSSQPATRTTDTDHDSHATPYNNRSWIRKVSAKGRKELQQSPFSTHSLSPTFKRPIDFAKTRVGGVDDPYFGKEKDNLHNMTLCELTARACKAADTGDLRLLDICNQEIRARTTTSPQQQSTHNGNPRQSPQNQQQQSPSSPASTTASSCTVLSRSSSGEDSVLGFSASKKPVCKNLGQFFDDDSDSASCITTSSKPLHKNDIRAYFPRAKPTRSPHKNFTTAKVKVSTPVTIDLTGPTLHVAPEKRGGDLSPLSAKAEQIGKNSSPISAEAEPLIIATQYTPESYTRKTGPESTPECPDSAASLHMSKVTEALFDSPLEFQRIPLPPHPIMGKPFSEQPVYYAVAVGRNPGTYINKGDAHLQIQRFDGAIWAICDSQQQAEEFIHIFNPKNIPFMPDSRRGIHTPPPRFRFNAFAPNAHLTWPGNLTNSESEDEEENDAMKVRRIFYTSHQKRSQNRSHFRAQA